ncbi:uncharacterized protein SAPINGB_P002657 [Magnusiomyces paraingens]|uniref:Peptidase A1 domain-containing protein n=1 Tax=Magnusiomyces paraingens TaxID=2606893 RepID=A0A5E8BF13_9ASCO|nr:uncharacterized protein SAPINGB_P002657 [Saprochaete ingens]VVT50213.1 unnamed protein product [Saprochaete ingens]
MKLSSGLAAAAFFGLALSAPAHRPKFMRSRENSAGMLSLDVTRRETPVSVSTLKAAMLAQMNADIGNKSSLDDSLFTVDLMNQITHYSVNIGIGTNNKQYPLLIDTGSSDFWVSNSTDIVDIPYDYASDKSKTLTTKPFHIDYVKGSMDGFWAKNTMYFGSRIDDVDYAIVHKGVDSPKIRQSSGILGTSYSYRGNKNLPELLAYQGLINKNAYSLSLANFNGSNGNLLFGGVDHSKYTGDLVTVPRADFENSRLKTLSAKLTSLNIDGKSYTINGDKGIVAPLDTGTTLSYLPSDIYNQLASAFGVNSVNTLVYGAPCFDVSKYGDKEVTFNFTGALIKVKGSDLALDFKDYTGVDQGNMNIFGIWSNTYTRGYNILGDTFLRSAYIVYDLDGNTISLAQANRNPGAPDIEVIYDDIPGAISVSEL